MPSSIDSKQSGTAASFEDKSPLSDVASRNDDADPVSSDQDDDDSDDDDDDGFEPDHSGPTAEDEAKTRGRVNRAVAAGDRIMQAAAAGNLDNMPVIIPAPPGTPPPPPAPDMF